MALAVAIISMAAAVIGLFTSCFVGLKGREHGKLDNKRFREQGDKIDEQGKDIADIITSMNGTFRPGGDGK